MADRWDAAFLVDETWRYSEAAFGRISEAVGAEHAERVNHWARVYRSMRANEKQKPKSGAIRKQLVELANACQRLRDALDMHDNTIEALDDAMPGYSTGGIRRRLADDAEVLRDLAWTVERDLDGRGRPSEESRRFLLHRLRDVWTDVHGAPSRVHANGREEGRFVAFVRVCVAELPGFQHGLDDLIREVVAR